MKNEKLDWLEKEKLKDFDKILPHEYQFQWTEYIWRQ